MVKFFNNNKNLFKSSKIIFNLGGVKNILKCDYCDDKIFFSINVRKLVNIEYFRKHKNIVNFFFKKKELSFSSNIKIMELSREIKAIIRYNGLT